MPFSTLGLSAALLQAIEDSGYTRPTPIQQQAIPAVLSGRDLLAAAQTGTGKPPALPYPYCNVWRKPVTAAIAR